MTVKTYDPSNVTMFYGPIQMQGFAQDAAISVEHDEDDWTLVVGVDGEGTRSKTSNRSATITVSLMQSSLVNALLDAERELDALTPGGTGGLPILIKDLSGATLLAAESAWIQKPPTVELNRESTTREWVFRTDALAPAAIHGGN
jgi:hypothetical protein